MKTLQFTGFLILVLSACSGGEKTNDSIHAEKESSELALQPDLQDEQTKQEMKEMEYVVLKTNKGDITLELDPNKAPVTVENFLKYVDAGHYSGTIFHRVIPNFMVQGGGFTANGSQKETNSPIVLESDNGLTNDVGTVAMARTNSPNSATAQFFINVQKNDFLNYTPGNPGYAVFGKVSAGMDVVNEIRQTPTGVKNGMQDWPQETIVIESAKRE